MQADYQKEQSTGDVKDRDDMFVVEVEVQGYLREEIQAIFHQGFLTVTATRPDQENTAEGFKKAVYIGRNVSAAHIRAAFHGGVLKCMIPKDTKTTKSAEQPPFVVEII